LNISDKLPAFGGYLTLLGAFVLVIGIAYALIARGELLRNADLILVGTLYKLAYSGTAFYYWSQGNLPHIAFAALFGVADAVFFRLDGGMLLVFEAGTHKFETGRRRLSVPSRTRNDFW